MSTTGFRVVLPPNRAGSNKGSPISGEWGWHTVCSVPGQTRTAALRFAFANPAVARGFDLPASQPAGNPASSDSGVAAHFGLILRDQLPSAAVGESQVENTAEPQGERGAGAMHVSPLASPPATNGLAEDPNAFSIARQSAATEPSSAEPQLKYLPIGTLSRAHPAVDSFPGEASPRFGAESAIESALPDSLSDSTARSASANAGSAMETDTRNSGSVTMPEPEPGAPPVADEPAKQSGAAQRKDQAIPAERTSDARKRSDTTKRADSVRAQPAPSPMDAGALPASPAIASAPAGQEVSPVVDPSGASTATGSLPEGAAARGTAQMLTSSHHPASSPSPSSVPSLGQRSASGTLGDHTQEAGGASVADPPRAPHLRARDASALASQLRNAEVQGGQETPGNAVQRSRPAGEPLLSQTAQTSQAPAAAISATAAPLSTGSSVRDLRPSAAFERMDGAEPPRVLESSPQKLAVGVRDAGLGWVEIRTRAVTGQVAATLTSTTHAAQTAISAELPAIRETLMNHHVALHSLSAERFPASQGGGHSGSNAPDSGTPTRPSFAKTKTETSAVQSEAEGEGLSYISVRV